MRFFLFFLSKMYFYQIVVILYVILAFTQNHKTKRRKIAE